MNDSDSIGRSGRSPGTLQGRVGWSLGQLGLAGITMIFCGLCGLFLGPLGASLAGLKPVSSGDFNLEPLVYLSIGAVAGALLFLIMAFLIFRRGDPTKRIVKGMLVAVIGSFFFGWAGYRVVELDKNRNREIDRERATRELVRYKDYHQLIKENPEIVLAEKWYLYSSGPDVRWRAYRYSLGNPNVPYTASVLSRLLNVEQERDCLRLILQHPQLDPRRLEVEYEVALEGAEDSEVAAERLVTILSGPQAKKEWYGEVEGLVADGAAPWKLRLRAMLDERRTGE